jgi:hypothetical protein
MRTESGNPVLVKVPFYNEVVGERLKATGECPEDIEIGKYLDQFDRSDEGVAKFINGRLARGQIALPDYIPWQRTQSDPITDPTTRPQKTPKPEISLSDTVKDELQQMRQWQAEKGRQMEGKHDERR